MSKIPKHGATPLLYVLEESRGHAWRPIGAGTLDQREALVMLDAQVSSYTRRVVQVVAVRLPGQDAELGDRSSRMLAGMAQVHAALFGQQPAPAPADFPRPRGVTP